MRGSSLKTRREGKQPACAFVLIDGLGDVQLPQLSHRTPLQAAQTPALDAIAGAYCLSNKQRQAQLALLLTFIC